jgi:hypothetical protein
MLSLSAAKGGSILVYLARRNKLEALKARKNAEYEEKAGKRLDGKVIRPIR